MGRFLLAFASWFMSRALAVRIFSSAPSRASLPAGLLLAWFHKFVSPSLYCSLTVASMYGRPSICSGLIIGGAPEVGGCAIVVKATGRRNENQC